MGWGLIFDCDGVILDTERAWDEANRVFLARRGATYVREEHKPLLTGRDLPDGVRILQSIFGFDGDPDILADERRALARLHLGRVEFVTGFEAFFAWAQPRFPVAVATGLDASLFGFVDAHAGLSGRFNGHVVVSSDVAHAKPEPDVLLAAAARLGLEPAACIVIEDAPLGIEAARRAGMVSVGLATTYPPEFLVAADIVAPDWPAAHAAILHLTGNGP